jgi:excisionase family DNA binding protein
VTQQTVNTWIRTGKLKATKIGNAYRITQAEVWQFTGTGSCEALNKSLERDTEALKRFLDKLNEEK